MGLRISSISRDGLTSRSKLTGPSFNAVNKMQRGDITPGRSTLNNNISHVSNSSDEEAVEILDRKGFF
jgi:hypothetical protein